MSSTIADLTDGATANVTDRLPIARSPFGAGDNCYITPEYLRALIISTANTWTENQTISLNGPEFRITSTTNNNATIRFAESGSNIVGYIGRNASQFGIFDGGAAMILGFSTASMVKFFGTTSSFPALKRSSAILQGRLGDDSNFCVLQAIHRTHANAVAETPTATHTIAIQDAAGTTYRVLALV